MTTRSLWAALDGDAEAVTRVNVLGAGPWLGGPLAVDDLAVGAVATALLAASALAAARGFAPPAVELSAEHVALSFCSERHAVVAGRTAGAGFAPLSRFVRCRCDGWARTHGNYPHHAAALMRALRIDSISDDRGALDALESAALSLDALALEDAVVAAGGCAAAMRSAEQWSAHRAGQLVASGPIVAWDESVPVDGPRALAALSDPARPAAGVRVLDLTRVIAGPVAGRTLAALGAEVLRIDPPGMPELEAQHIDMNPGKRTAVFDLADAPRRESLLEGADVVLMGYRPGALDRFDMRADQLAARHPHLIQVSLSAWGAIGPWASRRGFDSLVQSASGIAVECAAEDGSPGALPAQVLDHATGHLIAAAALTGLVRRCREQPHPPARLSLARTAVELLRAPRPATPTGELTGCADPDRHRAAFDQVALIAAPGKLDGVPLRWEHGPRPFGQDQPRW
jgi:CoA-transferase family III